MIVLRLILLLALCASAAENPFLHVSQAGANAGQLVDAAGAPVRLRGINLGNWLVAEGYMLLLDEGGPEAEHEIDALFRDLAGPDATARFWREWRKRYITAADLEYIASLGFNTIRVPLHHARLGAGGEDWAHLDRLMALARTHKLYVILDLHAAPGGQTGTNIDDSWGYPWLFESEAAQAETVALWKRIAEHYRNEPALAGYDLLNEPIPHFGDLPQRFNARLEPLYKRIAAAIRSVDARHLLILEGTQWASRFDALGPPFDPNSMYSFHKYWTAANREVIAEYLDYARRHRVPLLLGESGENTDAWIADFRAVLEREGVHWTFWPYKKLVKTSSLVSVAQPAGWDAIVAYAKLAASGGVAKAEKRAAARPSPQAAQAALEALLRAIDFANCTRNRGYEAALGAAESRTTRK